MRRILALLLGTSATLLVVMSALWWALQPPPLVVAPQSELVLDDVTVVNPGVDWRPHQRVVIRDGRIVEIIGSPTKASSPERSNPFGGMFVLPGLIDMHVHLPPWFLPGQLELFNTLFLAHGVTSIRETGSIDGRVFEVRRAIEAGERAGPRVFACGPFLDGDPPVWPIARVVHDAAEGRAVVRELAESGADCVKVYDNLSEDALQGIHEAASALGIPVVGHVSAELPWTETRIDDIQHVCQPRCGRLGRSNLQELVETSARAGIAHTPTLVVYERWLELREGFGSTRSPAAALMPRIWREMIWNPEFHLGFLDHSKTEGREDQRGMREFVERIEDAVRQLHRAGVRIHAGTDPFNPYVVPGASLHEELRLLVEADLSSEEALAAATRVPGEDLGAPNLGRVETGAPADLLILRDDPSRTLEALSSAEAVVAQGRLYRRAALEDALQRQRRYFESLLFDRFSIVLATATATMRDLLP
jgi:cytosine/adenosine deaminase-related metal-dependent hydrolase